MLRAALFGDFLQQKIHFRKIGDPRLALNVNILALQAAFN